MLSVIANGEVVGFLKAEYQPVTSEQQQVQLEYVVDNNGRGPKHKASILLSKTGLPLQWQINGTSLMGGEVNEWYRWRNSEATWQSQADSGSVSAPVPALYVSNDSNPWNLGLYARALLQAPQHRLDVLPGGELRLTALPLPESVLPLQKLQLYRLTGLTLEPSYLLLDQQHVLFAVFSAIGVTVRQGFETEANRLQQLAAELEQQRFKQLQQQLAHQSNKPLRLINVRIFSPQDGTLSGLMSVQVKQGRISDISPWKPGIAYAEDVQFDGDGGTLIPGLHDMHSHTTLESGLWYLAAGVTSVRDMGNDNTFLLDLIPRIETGEVAGPRIVRNGFIEGRSLYSARDGYVVDNENDALDKVRWYHQHDYWQIKIYNSLNPKWVPVITKEAHRLGMTVTGHIPAFTNADQMIAAGYDEITHINQLMLGWLLQPEEDTRTPLRLTAMVRAAGLDLSSAPVSHTLALMQHHHIALDPTAVILERLMLSRAGKVAEADRFYLSHMPVGYQRYRQRTFVPGLTPELDLQYQQAFDVILQLLFKLHQQGIQLLPGTDDPSGFTVHRELELYVKAGISPADTLRIATLGCEQYLGRDSDLGSIETGKLADMVLLHGNPLQDISEVRKPRMVIKDHFYYFPSEIYQALGVKPFTTPPLQSVPTKR